jgi:hypothetical protein
VEKKKNQPEPAKTEAAPSPREGGNQGLLRPGGAPAAREGKVRWKFDNSFILIAVLAVIVTVIFSSFLFDGRKMLFGSDTMAGLDSRVVYQTAIDKYHQFPLWFNTRLSGMPTIDALFADAEYLPTFIMLKFFPVYRALGLRLVLHIFLAGMFFFLLLRKGFRTSRFVAFIGAAFYMLNPEFFSHVYPGHDGKIFVIAWLPFVVWMCKSLLDKPRLLAASGLAAGVAICLYTSQIQMTYFVLGGLFFYWVMHTVLLYVKEKKASALIPQAVFWGGAVLVGVAMALPQLLPSFQYIRDAYSVRGPDRGFEYAASWSLHWPEFFSLWVPEFGNTLNNYWSENPFKLNSEYAGAMATLFAVMAVVMKAKPWRLFWAAVCAVTVLFSLGAHTPVFHIAYAVIPGIRKFRACSMLMFWFSFGTILLASLFLKDVTRGYFDGLSDQRRKKWQKGLVMAIAAITALAFLFSVKGFVLGLMQNLTTSLADRQKQQIFEANFSKNFVPYLWVWWLFAATSLGLLWGVAAKKINKHVFCAVVLLIGLVDVIRVDSQFISVVNPAPYFASDPTIADLQREMQIEPFRVFTIPGTLPQNAEGIHMLEGVGGFHDNELRWYREFRGDQQDRNFLDKLVGIMDNGSPYLIAENMKNGNSFLDIANVKYYLVGSGSRLMKIRNEAALGRISFARDFVVLDSGRIVDALRSGSYDIRKTVALLKEPKVKPSTQSPSPADSLDPQGLLSVKWDTYTPNYRKASVSVRRDGFLRISEVFYPGWEIRVDSKDVPVYRADLAWMAVNVTRGDHVVEMVPHSLYLHKAELVSFPLIALLGLYWIFVIAGARLGKKRS